MRWDPTTAINPLAEVPLIERIRQQNIERNKELFISLGLDEPLAEPRAPPQPRQRRPPAAAMRCAPARGGRSGAGGELATYQLGFDFGYAHALLALQRYDVDDLLSLTFGEQMAATIIDTYLARANSTTEKGSARDPFSVVLFARVHLRVVGLLLFRLHEREALPSLLEVPLVAVPQEPLGGGIADALMTYARLIAAQSVFGERPKCVVAWAAVDAAGVEQSLPLAASPANLGGLPLSAPPHLPGARLHHLADGGGSLYSQLEQLTAAAVTSLVASNPSATAAAKAEAMAQEEGARRLVRTSELVVEVRGYEGPLGPRQALPNHSEGLEGRTVLLWGVEDAQFQYFHIEFLENSLAGGSAKTPTAAATRVQGLQQETLVHGNFYKYDDAARSYVEECGGPLYGHELLECPTVLWASDREACIRYGLAIDILGHEIRVCRPYLPLAVKPSADGHTLFVRQLTELATCCCSTEFVDRRPELDTHFGPRLIWEVEPQVLMARVDKHIANHERQPPSASADSHVMSKEAWRCESWEQVQQRAACIDILSHMQGSVGFADHPPCASARHPSSRSCASEAASPCTQPRVLELYCGRGGLSAHHHKMGSAAFFLDWNREYVSKSFHEMPELDAGGQVTCTACMPLISPRPGRRIVRRMVLVCSGLPCPP